MSDDHPDGTDGSQPDGALRGGGRYPGDGFDRSMVGLAGLLAGTEPLSTTLTHIARFAAQAIPGADGAGLTLLEQDRPDTIVASEPFVRDVDAIQYGLGEGPCITAVIEARVITSGSLSREPAWPRFGPRTGQLGVHSVVSLPLTLPDAVIGALNVYAHHRNAFDAQAVEFGRRFAVQAAVSAHNAQVLARSRRLVEQLGSAVTARAVVDQAIGIVRARTGLDSDSALQRLRDVSSAEHADLFAVAQRVVDEAVLRARGRGRDA